MNYKGAQSTSKSPLPVQKNPLEAFQELGSSTARSGLDAFKNIGSGIASDMFEPFFGYKDAEQEGTEPNQENKPQIPFRRTEYRTLFDAQKEQEMRVIKELTEQIKHEIELIKKANTALVQEVKDIENLTVQELPEKPGIYHIRFLEVVLSLLRTLKAKITESNTWLEAMQSKKKKQGSLFASLSKKKGTQYSLSQELSNARSVQ